MHPHIRHKQAHPKGGFNLSSDPLQSGQVQSANSELVKRLGSRVYNGESCNVFKVRKPILLCQDFTLLEAIAE